MDKSTSPLARGASYLLIYLTAFQPLHPAFAAGITAANGNTQVHMKPGNVPVVNIATPNGAGISHNTYKDFNVGTPGAVLNNAIQGGKTQLGVTIENAKGNPNLKGKPAELIINEVTGGSRSELQGKLEVFGNKANVMIANPNGITCNGCGFINAPGVTLTTGKPQFDKQGALEALEVKKGGVTIGGKGLDGSGADYVDIISRATELNGKINAQNLSLTQGANRISFKDGTIKPIAGEGAKPVLAVDTKALGGMYANKIRLVANEDGVGVNLKDLTSKQRDITLSVSGRIELGNTQAATDLNASAREIHISSGVKVRGERDVTMAADTLNNNGNVTAHRDMRVFADTVRNVALRDGDNTALHSNNNLWIQKDAQGNKAKQIENRSARIQTNSGDLVIRTENLTNVRQEVQAVWKNTPANSKAFNKSLVGSYYDSRQGVDAIVLLEPELKDFGIGSWFGEINLSKGDKVNVGKDEYLLVKSQAPGVINSGNNAYINATTLWNDQSNISAAKDLILTGNDFTVKSIQLGQKDRYWRLGTNTFGVGAFARDEDAPPGDWDLLYVTEKAPYTKQQELVVWRAKGQQKSSITAGNNLTADFKNKIEISTPTPHENQLNEVVTSGRPESLKARNVLLHAKNIVGTDAIRADGNITAIAEDRIVLGQGILAAGKELSLTAVNAIDAWQSELKGQDVTLNAKNGEIKIHSSEKPHYFRPDGSRWLGSLEASRDLSLTAGSTITLLNTLLAPQSRNIAMTANGSIAIVKNSALLEGSLLGGPVSPAKRQEYFNQLLASGQMRATGSVLLNSGGYLALRGAKINADKDVTLLAAHNADLNYRELDGRFNALFPVSRTPELGSRVHAGGNLLINSARDIGTQGGALSANGNITLLAGQNLWLSNLAYSAIDAANDNNKDDRHVVTALSAGKNLTASANNQLLTYGARLTSGANMTLTSGGDMRFEAVQNHTYREGGNEFTETRTQQGTELNAGGLMTVIAGGSILFQATKLVVKGLGANWKPSVAVTDWGSRIAIAEQQLQNAQQRINQALQDKSRAEQAKNSKSNEFNTLQRDIDTLRQRQADNLRKTQEFSAKHGKLMEINDWGLWQQSAALAAEGIGITHELLEKEKRANILPNEINAEQSAFNNAQQRLTQATQDRDGAQSRLATARNEAKSKGADETKQKAQVDAHNQAEAMRVGNMDIAAKGGYLYAQAMEESSHYEKKETKRKWWGKKTEVKQTRHDVTNKVTEFTAAGNITLMSRDDSTYEASKIAAGQNARLTSSRGQVNFRAVKNTSFEQTVSNSKGFFIKQANKGYEDNKWVLPSIHTGGALTVEAAKGVSADVKVKNGQALQSAIDALGNTPGTTWVKDLNKRNDVQWSKVKDAYDSWDYKSQHLNPAVAAVIAIAAAAVTAGSSLAASAASSVSGAVGGGAVTSGAVTAGMSSLASQAAVALVENQGNLSKTLQALGSNENVKATATAMAIGGALNGFDSAMGWSKDAAGKPLNPNNVKLPQLSNGDWSKVAQRVAGQSVISSSLNTAINGGSFKDNLTNALLANIGSQVQAEGANLIGDNGQVLNIPGRAVSHAVLAGVAAEIGKGNAKGAAAGALAAELAGVIINDNLVRSEGWQERQAQISRVAGAFAGAIVTAKAAGATSGANAGEFVERFNRQLHQEELNAIKALAKGDKEKEARLMAASCRKVACTTQEALNSDERKQFEALMNKYPSTRDEDGLIANYWVQKERQRFGNYPAFAGYDSEKLFTYDLGDQITDGQLFARNQQIEQISKLTGWSPDWVNASVMAVSIASTFAGMGKANVGNQYLSSKLVGPTSAWKGYLVNEKTVQQAAAFRQQVLDARAPFAEKIRKKGNAAVAQIDVPGMPKTLAAHSRIAKAEKSFIGDGNQNFKYETIKSSDGILISRNTDSEYKILDNLADKLGNNVSAEGRVTIFTERAACESCLGVVEQFQKKYPGIKVEVLDNNDVMLIPGRLK
ncbi:TPA: filamentous hemagglutinin N-terminal domain-containing protein [Serratia marcescens]|nr:filamentous hemagglutinin N-terminal domain-containing protein [Serratia marcescens]HAT4513171.1 filamentous hemagglutinin N-terminal domain-containing protein [Serratia marcescens]HAT4537055.1 filamentous hemagglutinin N-terminal domain-containing protein [Serratia marcescens]